MITTKLIFDRRKTASRTREGYVEVRVTIDRMTKYISTGVRVYKNEWAADRVVNRKDAQVLNDRLAIIFEKVCQAATESVKQGVKLDTESVKQAVWQFVESQSNQAPCLAQDGRLASMRMIAGATIFKARGEPKTDISREVFICCFSK